MNSYLGQLQQQQYAALQAGMAYAHATTTGAFLGSLMPPSQPLSGYYVEAENKNLLLLEEEV